MTKALKDAVSNHRVLVGMTPAQFAFVESTSKRLKTTNTDALRQVIQFSRKNPAFKDFIKAEKEARKAK